MEREPPQQNPSSLLSKSIPTKEDSPRKPPPAGAGDRLKRDEWSEGAVASLLEAYESKWVLRNRAKLKGQDWEDVARCVSSRANSSKSPKTQTQCKNKIESMKKRYRAESATAEASSWPLYSRLDLLLRGTAPPPPPPAQPSQMQQDAPPPTPAAVNAALVITEPSHATPQGAQQNAAVATGAAQNSLGSNGVDKVAKEDVVGTKIGDLSDHIPLETDSSTPALYSDKDKSSSRKMKMKTEKKKRRRRDEEMEIAESIRWLAEVVVRSEQARMETMKEIEKMRADAEEKRGEMDLKRTEIIANTQLEIAKLLAGVGKGVESSFKVGKN